MLKLPFASSNNGLSIKVRRHISRDLDDTNKERDIDNITGAAKDVKDAQNEGNEKGRENQAIASMRRHNAQLVANIYENIGNVVTASTYVEDVYMKQANDVKTLSDEVIQRNEKIHEAKRNFEAKYATGKLSATEAAEYGLEGPDVDI